MGELIEVEKKTIVQAFSEEDGLEQAIAKTREAVHKFEHDLSTKAGRQRTASLAYKVAQLKSKLDDMGKDLVSDWKTKAKAVDKNRKAMRDALDELKIEARKPLTDWEAEEAARIEAERLAAEIEAGHELGLFMNEEFDRKAKEETERIEAERVAKEKSIAEEAAAKAKAEAEAKAKADAERIEQEKQAAIKAAEDAELAKQQAERDRIAAEERRKAEAELAEKNRIAAEEKAKRDAEEAAERAKQQEIARQQAEAKRIEDDRIAREKDLQHTSNVMRKAKEDIMHVSGISEDQAKSIVLAIKKNNIFGVSIQF